MNNRTMSIGAIVIIAIVAIIYFTTQQKITTSNIFAKGDIINLQLKDGIVKIKTFDDKAPKHVEHIKKLISEGRYDGVVFHRVIDGFMAQTGDVQFGNSDSENYDLRRAGTGGSGQNIDQEFNDTPHSKGTLSMARSSDPNSADSQFFICFDDAPHLDGQYTAWGQVTEGMEFIDMIKKGDPMKNGSVDDPDKIIKMWID
jgi:peptidyl-prolyl cis-trans isomerase B (cyclophilin B)